MPCSPEEFTQRLYRAFDDTPLGKDEAEELLREVGVDVEQSLRRLLNRLNTHDVGSEK
jgi:hypothetical protein